VRIVKFATDISKSKQRNAELEGMQRAINRAQAVIEFDLKGQILNANENFLAIFGYRLDEIVGQHHRIFCEASYTDSAAYKEFWQRLGEGEFDCGEFKRLAKDGHEIWLQASYNPIFDAASRPVKVVKFASDITEEIQKRSLALLEMATPVTKIWDGVLFAPIVGIIDSKRAIDIMEKTLSSIAQNRASTLVVDISGVAIVDTAVANHLIKITKAAVLMGCQSMISGISPAIAQTITELGIDLGSVRTTSTIEAALQEVIMKHDAASQA
jgi:methyl-accepting chemotaxis protein